jgi:hypothetical protein
MTYIPQINDYVIWTKQVEGWVYFVDESYITIEHSIRKKDKINYQCCPIHQNDRVLVVCYANRWKELTYVKSRQSIYENCMETMGKGTGRESIKM